MSDFRFSIDLPVTSRWENVDLLRASVQSCFTAVFQNIDGCHAIAMVTGELLENAVKYGAWAEAGSFRLRVEGSGRTATVSVENPIVKDDPNVGELLESLRWLSGFTDVSEAYRARLLEIASAPRDSARGLGLVRAAYEGNCTLTAEVAERAVRVVAVLSF
jgi:two-component sensor histidine kinase